MTDTPKLDELLAAVKKLPAEKIPQHVAIIMDGNGRWANMRNLHRTEGHKAGVASVKRLVKFVPIVGVKMLTLYTFSTENWSRPQFEVRTLMSLLSESTMRELDELVANNVKLTVSGKFDELPTAQKMVLERAMKKTEGGTRLWLNLALNYGGRAEIINAVRQIASLAKANHIDIAQIDEKLFARHTYTANLPDPELLIRTGGDFRISNFLLWQVAYTELHFAQEFWPDFDETCFCKALLDYASRDRRFGGVNEK